MTTPSIFRNASTGILALLCVLFFAGCTTQRDGRMYRAYHNTTAHFNGFYYARLAMEEADAKLLESREEDWDEVIPLFVYGTEKDAEFLYPLMERAIEKCSRVVERHAMTPGNREKKDFDHPKLNRFEILCQQPVSKKFGACLGGVLLQPLDWTEVGIPPLAITFAAVPPSLPSRYILQPMSL